MADKSVFANQGPTKPSVPMSTYDLSHSNNMTARLGVAYPCWVYDAPAGSSFKIRPYVAFDMQPFVFPIQTNIRIHVKFYRVPKRILWKHFKEFIGQHGPNGSTTNPYTMPFIKRVENFYHTRSLADYLGIPSTTVSDFNGTRQVPVSFVHSYRTLRDGNQTDFLPTNTYTEDLYLRHGFSFSCESDLDLSTPVFFFRFRLPAGKSVTDLTGNLFFAQYDSVFSATDVYGDYYPYGYLAGQQENVDYFRAHVTELAFQAGGVLSEDDVDAGKWSYLTGSIDDRMVTIVMNLPADFLQSRNGSYQFALIWPSSSWTLFGGPTSAFTVETTTIDGAATSKDDVTEIELTSTINVSNLPHWENCVYHFASAAVNSSTATHFRSVSGEDPVLPLNALPFRAYEFIGNYFFRNERVTPFMKDGHPVFNEFITNDGDGADGTTPVDFFSVPYEYDLFTTCVKEPQFGNAPLVGITTNSDNSAVMHMQDISVDGDGTVLQDGTYNIGVRLDDDANIISISNYDEVADKPSVMRLQEAIQYGISINDFRNVNALQRFQERHLKAGTKYQNIVFEFFGTNPPIGEEYPTYLGGVTSPIKVSKITNMADTQSMQLGDFAGQGSFNAKGNRIKCFCSEDSIIMGIVYFTCTPVYSQKLDRMWTKSHLLDYYNPQFANLGPQPVYKHQLCPLQLSNTGDADDPADLFSVFGYNRPFSEYVSCQDEVHGDFRETMQRYLLQRRFSGVPSLNEDFININPDELTDVFSVLLNTDKIFGQIYFDIRAKLPIPRFAVPRII